VAACQESSQQAKVRLKKKIISVLFDGIEWRGHVGGVDCRGFVVLVLQAVTGARIRQSGGSRQAHMKKVDAAKARREAQGK
jgi:cell wall-associated NlpC family hydrolase